MPLVFNPTHHTKTSKQWRFIVGLLALLIACTVSNTATADLTTGLVAYWSFDDCTAKDISGTGNSGSLVGSPGCVTGVSGTGLDLNGGNYAQIPDSASLDVSSSFTISVWFNAHALSASRPTRLVDKITAGYGDGYMLDVWTGGLRLGGSTKGALATVSISSGVLHHAVVSFSQDVARFYLDGQFVGTGNVGATSVPINTLPVKIGASQGSAASSADNFNGMIDEVRIYNRTLTDTEIATLAGVVVEKPIISASPTDLLFGQQPVGQLTKKTVTLSNTGTGTLDIGTLNLNGDADFTFDTNSCNNAHLVKDATCEFTVAFNPTSVGVKSSYVDVPSNVVGNPTRITLAGEGTRLSDIVELGIKGTTIPTAMEVGKKYPTKFTITNNGPKTATQISMDITLTKGISVVSTLPSGCQSNASNVTCSTAQLLKSKTWSVDLQLQASGDFIGTYKLSAKTDSFQTDSKLANNSLSANVSIGSSMGVTVTKTGTGDGAVTSSPASINCGDTCNATFTQPKVVNNKVTLTATAKLGSAFTGWSGACTGTSITCVIQGTNKSFTASAGFKLLPKDLMLDATPNTGDEGDVYQFSGINATSNANIVLHREHVQTKLDIPTALKADAKGSISSVWYTSEFSKGGVYKAWLEETVSKRKSKEIRFVLRAKPKVYLKMNQLLFSPKNNKVVTSFQTTATVSAAERKVDFYMGFHTSDNVVYYIDSTNKLSTVRKPMQANTTIKTLTTWKNSPVQFSFPKTAKSGAYYFWAEVYDIQAKQDLATSEVQFAYCAECDNPVSAIKPITKSALKTKQFVQNIKAKAAASSVIDDRPPLKKYIDAIGDNKFASETIDIFASKVLSEAAYGILKQSNETYKNVDELIILLNKILDDESDPSLSDNLKDSLAIIRVMELAFEHSGGNIYNAQFADKVADLFKTTQQTYDSWIRDCAFSSNVCEFSVTGRTQRSWTLFSSNVPITVQFYRVATLNCLEINSGKCSLDWEKNLMESPNYTENINANSMISKTVYFQPGVYKMIATNPKTGKKTYAVESFLKFRDTRSFLQYEE